MSNYFMEIKQAVIDGDANLTQELCMQSLAEGNVFGDILEQGLIAGMGVVGEVFKSGEVFIPDVMIAARAMHAGIDGMKASLSNDAEAKAKGTVVIGTIKDDLHDIGKNLVVMMLEGVGFKVIDLGIDVSVDAFIKGIKENHANIVAISALLTTTMVHMEATIASIKQAYGDTVKIIVGGAPVSQAFADQIGADGFGQDASAAAELALSLVGNQSA